MIGESGSTSFRVAGRIKMRILYIQYTNPAGYPPLQHGSRILAENGFKVLFLGTGARGAAALEFPLHPNVNLRRLTFYPAGWRQKLHYGLFTIWVLFWVLRWRPRWIYASDCLSCPVAALLSLLPGLRIIYHEHDSPNGTLDKSSSIFERLVPSVRRLVAQRASLCILPNQRRAESFKERTRTERLVLNVWNCPSSRDVKERSSRSGSFVLFFHGSIVPARLPMTVLEALAKLPDQVVLRVAGYETIGHSGYIKALQNYASKLGIGHRLSFLGSFVHRDTLLENCSNADVGLALMPLKTADINEQAMAGASNKPFDYLACGLALLVSELPEWKKMFVDPGYGLACDPGDPESIAQRLLWFIQHPVETRSMGTKGRQRILSEWNYERQFSPVLQAIGVTGVQH